jgi:hypothetical protein
MHPSRAASWATRSIPFETVCANLDALSRTDYHGQIKTESFREHETNPSMQQRNVNLQPPRNSLDGYNNPSGSSESRELRVAMGAAGWASTWTY